MGNPPQGVPGRIQGRSLCLLMVKNALTFYSASTKPEENVELHIATHVFMESVFSWRKHARQGIVDRCNLSHSLIGPHGPRWAKLPRVRITNRFISEEDYPKVLVCESLLWQLLVLNVMCCTDLHVR